MEKTILAIVLGVTISLLAIVYMSYRSREMDNTCRLAAIHASYPATDILAMCGGMSKW